MNSGLNLQRVCCYHGSAADQLVSPGSQTDLFPMGEGFFPADIRVAVFEVVVVVLPARLCQVIRELAVGERFRGEAEICAGLVQRYRGQACKNSDVVPLLISIFQKLRLHRLCQEFS